jgi:hypothetical protein
MLSDSNSNITISNSYFTYNNGGSYGSAIDQYNSYDNITINKCVFDSNYAENGFAISIYGETYGTKILSNEFTANTGNRGTIFLTYTSNIILDKNIFQNNTAAEGSAICGYRKY